MSSRDRGDSLLDQPAVLGWLIAVVVASFVIVLAPDFWLPWIALGFAAWLLVGFFLARGEEGSSVGYAFAHSAIAPLGALLFAPLLIGNPMEARRTRRLRRELVRIGAEGVRSGDVTDRFVQLYDVRPGEVNYGWFGNIDDAFRRLRTVDNNAGRDGFWNVFPDKVRSPSRTLNAELERIGVGPDPVAYQWTGMGNSDPLTIYDLWRDAEIAPPGRLWEWEGSTEEALRRMRAVGDGAGRDAFWDAFPEKTWGDGRLHLGREL